MHLALLVTPRVKKWNTPLEAIEELDQRLYGLCESKEEKSPFCFLCDEGVKNV